MNLLDHIKNFSQLKFALYVIIIVGSGAAGISIKMISYERIKIEQQAQRDLQDNIKDVTLEQTLIRLNTSLDSIKKSLGDLNGDFIKYKNSMDQEIEGLTKAINRMDRNLIFYIDYRDSLSGEQMKRVFDMVREEQKKTTVSKESSNINGGKNTLKNENQTSSLYP